MQRIRYSLTFSIITMVITVQLQSSQAVEAPMRPSTTPTKPNINTKTKPTLQSRTPKRLTIDTIAQPLRNMDYAVRGKVVSEADRIAEHLQDYDFSEIVYANIGNPQSVGQPALTWPRQVLALCDLPDQVGIDHPDILKLFPQDAVDRAREIKQGLGCGTGAYSHSKGAAILRKDVAEFITNRDGGVPTDADNIFLTNGASAAIHMILTALISKPTDGVMIPIPQYPIYSATVDLLNGSKVGYYLDEQSEWGLDIDELERAYQEATKAGITVNSLVLINPGNPTGQVLTRQNIHDILRFCVKHRLVLLADEVYQENVYQGQFYSCKKAAAELDLLDDIELVSFHSTSKGVFGECGRRGGYMELVGIDNAVTEELYKLASSSLCSTVSGQIMTALMCRGPKPGTPSWELHEREKAQIFESLKENSRIACDGLNAIPGFSCQPSAGSMYCFPKIDMPESILKLAKLTNETPDTVYCQSLLRQTGICVVPASGFGQASGRHGFRTTFLPANMKYCVEQIAKHHMSL